METNLFDLQVQRNQVIAKTNGGTCLTGAAAFDVDNKARRRNLDNSVFHDGDTIEVPFLPGDAAHPEDGAKYMALPISKGGDPVMRVLVKCTDKDGKESVKELFAGTLTKSALNRDTQINVATSGTAVEAIEDCVTNQDIWKAIAGKKLKFSNPKTVPTIVRGFNGRPDRQANTTIWQIDFVA
jgi:hypothetical protein